MKTPHRLRFPLVVAWMSLQCVMPFLFAQELRSTSDRSPAAPVHGPADLALTFRSPADGSEQPYRLYLPTAHDGKKPVPLLVALHGTGGDQNTYSDHPDSYGMSKQGIQRNLKEEP